MTNLSKLITALAVCGFVSACATTEPEAYVHTRSNAVDKEVAKEIDIEIETGLSAMIEEDPEIETLPSEPTFEELEEDFASVNKEQLKQDINQLSTQISETEKQLDQAQSVLAEMISEQKSAEEISAQKSKVVVLEDQLFDLNDEKSLKEIEASIE